MEAPRTRRRGDGSPSARSLLLTLLGEYVRYPGHERVWASAAVAALGSCGIREPATRRALARLAEEGWLRTESVGRRAQVVLEPRLVALLTAWTRRLERAVEETPWRGTWQQLLLRGPAQSHSLLAEQLAFEGFGALGQGVWIAADTGGVPALKALLCEQGLAPHATWLTSRTEDASIDAELVARAWDLAAVRAAHEDFLRRFAEAKVAAAASGDEEAFVLRTRLVHAWRGTFARDPRLPAALLPEGWPGDAATRRFVTTWRALRDPADRHWAALTGTPGR
ncbi:PaaX family transcriptional regulator [Actinomycetota bacterium Odt1-20B]